MRHWVRSYRLLLIWALLRTRNELPVYAVVQAMLSIGVVLGFGFVIPHMTASTALYLCTGSMTLSVITIGMLLAPQAISYQKQSGFLDFQRSLPVPRTTLMAADTTLWAAITLPGVVLAFIVSTFRFDLTYQPSPLIIPAILLVLVGAVSIGYTIAYLVRPVLVILTTNTILMVSLMLAPINYPASRLPHWLATIHQWLPFEYMGQAIRETIRVPATGVPVLPFIVLTTWCIIGLLMATRALAHRT